MNKAVVELGGEPCTRSPPALCLDDADSMSRESLLAQSAIAAGGGETFAVHPPSRFQELHQGVMSLQNLLGNLAQLATEVSNEGCEDTTRCGLRHLIKRMESGHFQADKEAIWNDGMESCEDMLPSRERVESGLAWFQNNVTVTG